jgi:hypothetical protein
VQLRVFTTAQKGIKYFEVNDPIVFKSLMNFRFRPVVPNDIELNDIEPSRNVLLLYVR